MSEITISSPIKNVIKVGSHIFLPSNNFDKSPQSLIANNIKYVINLSDSSFDTKYNQITFMNQSLNNKGFCYLMRMMPKYINFIDNVYKKKENVLIYSNKGNANPLTILIAYYMMKYDIDYNMVNNRLKRNTHLDMRSIKDINFTYLSNISNIIKSSGCF
jgi:hypothetical protein